jgi:hypothetical protein
MQLMTQPAMNNANHYSNQSTKMMPDLISGGPLLLTPKKNRVTSVNYVVSAICHDDVIWFINYIKEPHRTVIVKTDASGEIFYKISFPTPDNIDNSSGAITQSTLHSEGGYVYFEWWNFHLPANKIVIVRKMKIRLAEPQTHGREKHN